MADKTGLYVTAVVGVAAIVAMVLLYMNGGSSFALAEGGSPTGAMIAGFQENVKTGYGTNTQYRTTNDVEKNDVRFGYDTNLNCFSGARTAQGTNAPTSHLGITEVISCNNAWCYEGFNKRDAYAAGVVGGCGLRDTGTHGGMDGGR